MFGIGTEELLLILVIVTLLFGGKKIPEFTKSLGEAIRELRKAYNDEPTDKVKKHKSKRHV